MGHQQRAKDRRRLRRIREKVRPQEDPATETFEIMVCECGRVYRYGRGAWIPIAEGKAHSHVLRFSRAVL